MRPRANRIVLAIGIIFQIAGVIVVITSVMASRKNRYLLDHGQTTTGRVIAKWSTPSALADGETTYNVKITYSVRARGAQSPVSMPEVDQPRPSSPEGRLFETTVQPAQALFESLRAGSAIDIVYDPELPSRATLKQWLGGPWWGPMVIFGGAGGFFALVGFLLTLHGLGYLRTSAPDANVPP